MTDHNGATVTRVVVQGRIENHAVAAKTLDDPHYIAYVLVQAARLMIALFAKRWPQLG